MAFFCFSCFFVFFGKNYFFFDKRVFSQKCFFVFFLKKTHKNTKKHEEPKTPKKHEKHGRLFFSGRSVGHHSRRSVSVGRSVGRRSVGRPTVATVAGLYRSVGGRRSVGRSPRSQSAVGRHGRSVAIRHAQAAFREHHRRNSAC